MVVLSSSGRRRASIATLLTLTAVAATASPVTVAFSGLVNNDAFGLGFTAFSGNYTFDSAASDSAAGQSTGSYTSTGAGFGIDVSFDGGALIVSVAGSLNIGIANDFAGPVDQYTVLGASAYDTIELFMEDASATAFASDALPASPPDPAAFGFRQFRWFRTESGNEAEIFGTIDALVCTAGCGGTVAEPGSAALLAAALLAGLTSRRRRRARAA